eukprot:gene1532-1870_t
MPMALLASEGGSSSHKTLSSLAFPSAAAAAAEGVERLIHFSDMGAAADHPSRRMRTKDEGDEAVRYNFPNATVI